MRGGRKGEVFLSVSSWFKSNKLSPWNLLQALWVQHKLSPTLCRRVTRLTVRNQHSSEHLELSHSLTLCCVTKFNLKKQKDILSETETTSWSSISDVNLSLCVAFCCQSCLFVSPLQSTSFLIRYRCVQHDDPQNVCSAVLGVQATQRDLWLQILSVFDIYYVRSKWPLSWGEQRGRNMQQMSKARVELATAAIRTLVNQL